DFLQASHCLGGHDCHHLKQQLSWQRLPFGANRAQKSDAMRSTGNVHFLQKEDQLDDACGDVDDGARVRASLWEQLQKCGNLGSRVARTESLSNPKSTDRNQTYTIQKPR